MIEIAALKEMAEKVIADCQDLLKIFEAELHKLSQVSFDQVKEIEQAIHSLQKKGHHIPGELKHLKLKLVMDLERKENIQELENNFTSKFGNLLKDETITAIKRSDGNRRRYIQKKGVQFNYERPLGSKGNTALEDYLIPVIKLMRKGYSHEDAFHKIKDTLNVRYNTVSAQCTRTLGISTDDFLLLVESGKIVNLLENKYPDKYRLIKNELLI